jgi:hypothetical protein
VDGDYGRLRTVSSDEWGEQSVLRLEMRSVQKFYRQIQHNIVKRPLLLGVENH